MKRNRNGKATHLTPDPKNARRHGKRTRPHRPTAAEKEARISEVITHLLSGSRRIEVVQYAAKMWGISTRQSDKLIADATQWIKASTAKTRDEWIADHLSSMAFVYRAAESAGDHHAAIKARQEIAKLLGLYPTEKMRLDVYDWRDEARKAGINPDEALDEFERIVASKMATGHDDGGNSESEGAPDVDTSPVADSAGG